MSLQFCVLGSGSSGNASLLMTADRHVLIDAGFPPEEIAARLEGTGAAWPTLDAIVLTHTHGDHLQRRCLDFCARHDVQFICHSGHAAALAGGRYFKKLEHRKLVRIYADSEPLVLSPHLRLRAFPLPHDCPPTFGFRFEIRCTEQPAHAAVVQDGTAAYAGDAPHPERWVKLAYLADFGVAAPALAAALSDVDVLALEFNHDEDMERRSRRPAFLIDRVLSDEGHLSNRQAAALFHGVLSAGANGGPQVLLLLHLSRECNTPELAYAAAQAVIQASGARTRVFGTRQDKRGTLHRIA